MVRGAGRDLLDSVLDLGAVTVREHGEWLGRSPDNLCKAGTRLVEAGQLRRVEERPARWALSLSSPCLGLSYHRCGMREGRGGRYDTDAGGLCQGVLHGR